MDDRVPNPKKCTAENDQVAHPVDLIVVILNSPVIPLPLSH